MVSHTDHTGLGPQDMVLKPSPRFSQMELTRLGHKEDIQPGMWYACWRTTMVPTLLFPPSGYLALLHTRLEEEEELFRMSGVCRIPVLLGVSTGGGS